VGLAEITALGTGYADGLLAGPVCGAGMGLVMGAGGEHAPSASETNAAAAIKENSFCIKKNESGLAGRPRIISFAKRIARE
jgi:hypothetical protein